MKPIRVPVEFELAVTSYVAGCRQQYRTVAGLREALAAGGVAVSENTLSSYCRGEIRPSAGMVFALARISGRSLDGAAGLIPAGPRLQRLEEALLEVHAALTAQRQVTTG